MMYRHIHTNNAPVTGYDEAFPPVIADQILTDLGKAVDHLERARLALNLPRQFQTDMDDAINFIIQRYESIKIAG